MVRNGLTENKRVYVRFHKELDEIIDKFSKETGMRRATAVSWILNRFLAELARKKPDSDKTKISDLGFSPKGIAYRLPIGRSDSGRIAGRRTLITLEKSVARNLDFLATVAGITLSELRTEILVKYFTENNLL